MGARVRVMARLSAELTTAAAAGGCADGTGASGNDEDLEGRVGAGEKRAWESDSDEEEDECDDDALGEESAVDDEDGEHAAKRRRVDPFLALGL